MSQLTTRWWWLRHAPVINHGGVIYGNSEIACDLSDAAALGALAERLPDDAVWVTSQLGRARETAAALAAARDWTAPERRVEPDLAEQDFGDWQGRTLAEIERQGEPVQHNFWWAPAHHAPPGGESFAAVVERVAGVIERLTREHAGRDIVAVAHGGSIRAALVTALGLDPAAALAFHIHTLSLTRIDHIADSEHGGNWRIVAVNLPANLPAILPAR